MPLHKSLACVNCVAAMHTRTIVSFPESPSNTRRPIFFDRRIFAGYLPGFSVRILTRFGANVQTRAETKEIQAIYKDVFYNISS
jgi:hypothetical protein